MRMGSCFRFGVIGAFAALAYGPHALSVPVVARQVGTDVARLGGLKYRLVGPFRGGRVTSVAGIASDPWTYYFGAAGGGVWKTVDGGATWSPIFDDQSIGAVGALTVADSDPNVIYVGTGDSDLRNNVSHGNGVYKSSDAGRTWKHLGLVDTRHIGRIVIHPRDPNVAFVAALGSAFGPNTERGIFRTKDGGATWEKTLYVDEHTGGIDVTLDSRNPDILFAAMWQAQRLPWAFTSGGPGSGLYRSADGGATWTRLQGNGLPGGILGRIGVAVSPADSNRVYAIIEAEQRGLYKSDDAGRSWSLINTSSPILQRPWFFMNVIPDPQNRDVVWVLNINLLKSVDSGRTFQVIDQYHVDNQALWIAPNDSRRMINGSDGGANVTVNGGASWTRADNNQPTGQFYHVATDNRFPYYLYGGQQDFDTLAIASRSDYPAITGSDWYVVVHCEMGFVVPNPRDANIAYGGCTDGGISRYDHRNRRSQSVEPWPESYLGHGAEEGKYRFQWTAPIMISQHASANLYHAANVLFKSVDEGKNWKVISQDLTRNDKSKQKQSGGPLTKDNVGGEFYGTIFALVESPLKRGLLWAGTDDGLVHLTRDDGATWEDVTPRKMPEWSRISLIDASPHVEGGAYLAVDRHMLGDYLPHLYKTSDYGKTWTHIASGIPEGAFVRAVREDPVRRGLLYAGTETGVYKSFDDGASWQSLQQNLPVSPVHDLVVKDNDLAVATHGRGFWILDDVTPLRQFADKVTQEAAYLFKPAPAHRVRLDFTDVKVPAGQNAPPGAIIYYNLKTTPNGPVTLSIVDANGVTVRTYSSRPSRDARSDPYGRSSPLTEEPGLNRFVWDLRHAGHKPISDQLLIWHPPHAPPVGPLAVPGQYQVKLTVEGRTQSAPLELKPDPRLTSTAADLQAQFDLHSKLRDLLSDINDAVLQLRSIRQQLAAVRDRSGRGRPGGSATAARKLEEKATVIERALSDSRIRSGADAFNYGIALDNKVVALIGIVANSDTAPTSSSWTLFEELAQRVKTEVSRLNEIRTKELPNVSALAGQERASR